MVSVSKSRVHLIDGALVGEASEMGFKVGEWPEIVAVTDESNGGYLFLRSSPIRVHGEFEGYHYHTRDGVEMAVFND